MSFQKWPYLEASWMDLSSHSHLLIPEVEWFLFPIFKSAKAILFSSTPDIYSLFYFYLQPHSMSFIFVINFISAILFWKAWKLRFFLSNEVKDLKVFLCVKIMLFVVLLVSKAFSCESLSSKRASTPHIHLIHWSFLIPSFSQLGNWQTYSIYINR